MISFAAFLEGKVAPDIIQIWQGAFIQSVDVFRTRKMWRISILLPRPVSSQHMEQTRQALLNHHSFLDHIELSLQLIKPEQGLMSILDSRSNEIVSYLHTQCGVDIQQAQWTVSGHRVDFLVEEKSLYEKMIAAEICPALSAWFWQEYALRIVTRVRGQDHYLIRKADPVWVHSGQAESISFTNSHSDNNRSTLRNRRQKEQPVPEEVMPIADLQEGMRKAVIEGEVLVKEISSLRDGRFVVTYNLSDYDDTITVKSFVDKVEDEAIEKGDWLRVKGNVRYDNFIKEIVLFMDAFEQLKAPQRTDDSKEKRIELHAHTKMSAMDALTEIDALIKRAIEWEHPAIAITDHGCVQAFPMAYQAAKGSNIKIIYGVEAYLVQEDKKEKPFHIILLAKNLDGLHQLYQLVSTSYMDYFYRHPKLPRSILQEHREGLLLGSACEAGELYRALLRGASDEEIQAIVDFYDYLEIQPLANNSFLLRNGTVASKEELQDINRRIVQLGKENGKPVVATGDVHFLDPHHEIYRTIIQSGQGYQDAEAPVPLYFRNTAEMLAEFKYLGPQDARWVVIEAPSLVASQIEAIRPVPEGFYPPKIDSAEEEIIKLTWQGAHERYGDPLPDLVQERIEKELNAIVKHGFGVLYFIAHKLVQKSNDDGYLVGSRGSVGSSMVAYFTGITEVNALPPHYVCPTCYWSEFYTDRSVGCGADLEDRSCPDCGTALYKDGFDIPFETFLGFDGDKVPDIDLNFSGEYQSRAHQYVEELFGRENVYRAGTISTVAEKTAYGFVKKYEEENNLVLKEAEINRLVAGITGVRRTTGQHPGGMIVLPQGKNIFEFTPIQHPADNKESGVITTHFEYHSLEEQLVKLDILGHDDPTVIKFLEDMTGIDVREISLSDKETMQLFSSVEPLGVKAEDIYTTVGTYGIPEFGTRFVRQMLEATRPTTFAELVRISGLSHGTDVWLHNAADLIASETASLSEVICTRDDIMGYLIQKGMDEKQAFKIMEKVRKGKGLNTDEIEAMRSQQVPQWYIDSCQKIKYMFPKAHAVAYVMMAFRIAWFKVYYPLEFYAAFFSIRAEDFDASAALAGYDQLCRRIKEIEKMGYSAPQKDKKLIPILELAMEMCARGFVFHPVDIYASDARDFIVKEDGLILPFSALPNVGVAAAQLIVEARQQGPFVSVEDFQNRTRLNKTAMEMLREENCFQDLPESTQMSLFA